MADFGALPTLLLGFVLGLEHATDPDHVVAVTTVVTEHQDLRKTSTVGLFWGLGHTATVFVFGSLILVGVLAIPPPVAAAAEFLVGIVLVLLGGTILFQWVRERLHAHPHAHDAQVHEHVHLHRADGTTREPEHEHVARHLRRVNKPFLIGMVHGLAGTAALALLVLASVRDLWVGVVYLVLFGVGSILGMMVMSSIIGLPFVLSAKRFARFNGAIKIVAGLVSIGLGIFIMTSIGLAGP